MSIASLLIDIVLQLAFIPLAIGGGLLVGYRQIIVSRRLGVPQSAIEVINGRWTMHIFGIREDNAAVRLAAVLPNDSILGLWLCLLPLWIKYRISRKLFLYPRLPAPGEETLADLVVGRTVHFDRMISRVMTDVEQFVILGAGYDTRCYGPLRREGVTAFEVDEQTMQQHKVDSLRAADIEPSNVHFVPVDFQTDALGDRLLEAGYDPTRRTLFLWEGVTVATGRDTHIIARRLARRRRRSHLFGLSDACSWRRQCLHRDARISPHASERRIETPIVGDPPP